MYFKKQIGQTLLEIVVILAVLGLVLGGLITLLLNGSKNSQFSKNQAQATKLGQEALDSVRIMKNREDCQVIASGTSYYWINSTPLVWDNSAMIINKIYSVSLQPTCRLQEISTPLATDNFKRSIKLEADGVSLNRLKVISIISWTDVSGSHESNLFTILAQ
jgi:type II secretory pathway pseudopilin PulG